MTFNQDDVDFLKQQQQELVEALDCIELAISNSAINSREFFAGVALLGLMIGKEVDFEPIEHTAFRIALKMESLSLKSNSELREFLK